MSRAGFHAKPHVTQRFEPSKRHDRPRPAPGDLEILRGFLNTKEASGKEHGESKPEELSSPEDLASWLSSRELLPEGVSLTEDDLARAVWLRWAFRSLVVSRGRKGDEGEEREARVIRQVSEATPFRLVFEDDLEPRFEPSGTGVERAFGRLIQLFAEARREDRWRRFKVCGHCREMFYDHTPNRLGRWCRSRCGEYVRKKRSRRRLRQWRK